MIKNYIKIALRNLERQKIYSVITMSGLIIGFAVFILFALISVSLSDFDTFHKNAHRIYGVVQILPGGLEGEQHSAILPPPLLPALLNEFPEIEDGTQFFPPGRMIVRHQDKVFYESGIRFVDSHFLRIFSFKMVLGNAEKALSEPYSIVLTEDSALKYFGDENPMGRSLTLDNKIDAVVTGIAENVPTNSTISFDFLVSAETARTFYGRMDDWNINNHAIFLLLPEGYNPTALEAKLPDFINKHYEISPNSPKRLYLFPMLDFYKKSIDIERYWESGEFSFVALWIIAVLLLLIASINYMNLSTARYVTRAKEVGMRKVVGAYRSQLIKQFLGESILISLISLPAGILLYEVIGPALTAYLGVDFLNLSLWNKPQLLILISGVAVLTGIFAGSYPSFYLSVFKPVQILTGKIQKGKKGGRLRKTLVVVQFSFSIILIVFTLISVKQSDHNIRVDLGYDRNGIVAVEIAGAARDNIEPMKTELSRHPDIVSVSASQALPISWDTKHPVLPEGFDANDTLNMNIYGIDYDFIELLDIKLTQGRSFSPSYADAENFIINETAARQLQWKNPLGKQLTFEGRKGIVTGVAKDFHFKSIYQDHISPTVLYLEKKDLNYMLVKLSSPDKISGAVEYIREQWRILAPDIPFEYVSLNDYFHDAYIAGDKTAEMSGVLGILAIFLSCLGLFGLSSYAVERRLKEIGIRKVLGASVTGITWMLIKEFLKLVVIANIIAVPIAYLMMRNMIQFIYAYPVEIGIDIFLFTVSITAVIAFLTVSSQTLKAAQSNPVNSLKYE
ncbi:MAG: ABC transporter permease [Candidatus Aminicenantes bacterium]|nr:MAG: ABC transporter permease [Candidatus Aminicenantes bacterium]